MTFWKGRGRGGDSRGGLCVRSIYGIYTEKTCTRRYLVGTQCNYRGGDGVSRIYTAQSCATRSLLAPRACDASRRGFCCPCGCAWMFFSCARVARFEDLID